MNFVKRALGVKTAALKSLTQKSWTMSVSTLTQLQELVKDLPVQDYENGPTSSQSLLRLFGQKEADIRVTLYRDNHAWCPYCQKVWVWLEEQQIPYRVKKTTMFCYRPKDQWYLQIVPNGFLPALELDGKLITESDVILQNLENDFGPLYAPLSDKTVVELRRLERRLFAAWCQWLCYKRNRKSELAAQENFQSILKNVEEKLEGTPGPFFLQEFSCVDVIFLPFLERMSASLYYYKGFNMRNKSYWPRISRWFESFELRSSYRGSQSDFHTHVHDLPPQMGACHVSVLSELRDQIDQNQKLVNEGPWGKLPDVSYPPSPEIDAKTAAYRVLKHWDTLLEVNPVQREVLDVALRCALSHLLSRKIPNEVSTLPDEAAIGLRYLRDRISVPRDMPIHAAKMVSIVL